MAQYVRVLHDQGEADKCMHRCATRLYASHKVLLFAHDDIVTAKALRHSSTSWKGMLMQMLTDANSKPSLPTCLGALSLVAGCVAPETSIDLLQLSSQWLAGIKVEPLYCSSLLPAFRWDAQLLRLQTADCLQDCMSGVILAVLNFLANHL